MLSSFNWRRKFKVNVKIRMHLQSSYFGDRTLLQCGLNTSWGQQSFDRWVSCETTCNPAQGEDPD